MWGTPEGMVYLATGYWPKDAGDQQSLAMTARQLRWLIDGLNWQNAVAHQPFERRAMR